MISSRAILLLFLLWITAPSAQADLLGFEDAVEETNFAVMMKKYDHGVADHPPWAGFWWDFKHDGIARKVERDQPSASEKYDALMGLSARTASTAWEKENHGPHLEGIKEWWGHCNGWTAAAILAPEPRRKVTIDGIEFTVSDQKALLSETYLEVSADFLGSRHDEPTIRGEPTYNDPSPGQFHLATINLLGRQKQAFAIDRHTGDEVWNQPAIAYRLEKVRPEDDLGEHPQAPGIYRVVTRLTLWWVDDDVAPGFKTPKFRFDPDSAVFPSRTLTYELWLDGPLEFTSGGNLKSSGNIVVNEDPDTGEILSGKWLNTHLDRNERHPDFLWIPFEAAPATTYKNPHIDDEVVERIVRGISPQEEDLDENWMEKGFQ